jgi:uncharacterized protein
MAAIADVPLPQSAPLYKRFRSSVGEHVLVVPYSRLFDLSQETAADLDAKPGELHRLSQLLGERSPGEESMAAVVEPAPQNLSLNVSSACNLACSYCYADRGSFGGKQSERMSPETAFAAVDRLLMVADPAHPVTIGFLGGEPLLNRALVHSVVAYASQVGYSRGLDVRFSITTNGTVLSEEDIDLMRQHRFAVTVSLDGDAATQDSQRPDRMGRGSFERLVRCVSPLLANPGRAQVAARLTVGSALHDLVTRLDAVWGLGFCEAGVAPLRTAADASTLGESDWPTYLRQLIAVSKREIERARDGDTIRLTNLAVALKQIHRGACSPYPCGAGGGYFSVAANGRWHACHRAIGDEEFVLGDSQGLSNERRRTFLIERHVHSQAPCGTCWARYLCSGGCHQEVKARTTASCDFIRAWLEYCLAAYCELIADRPAYFVPSSSTMARSS